MSARSFVHDGIRRISIVNFRSGSVSIEPGPAADAVEGTLSAVDQGALDSVLVRQEYDRLVIEVLDRGWRHTDLHLRLGAPPGLDYDVQSGSADVRLTVPARAAKLGTGSGDVSVDRVDTLRVSTGSGTISTGELGGDQARLTSGSGAISVASARCRLSAKSGSGDILVRRLEWAPLEASSGSGDIAVAATTGSVELRSASGSLTVGVAEGLPAWLDLHSVSGDIRIALDAGEQPAPGEPFVTVSGRTASGAIAVYRA